MLTPERLPILETERAVNALKSAAIPVAGAIINRLLPEDDDSAFWATRRERQSRHLADIDQRLKGIKQLRLPLFEDDIQGGDALQAFAAKLVDPA